MAVRQDVATTKVTEFVPSSSQWATHVTPPPSHPAIPNVGTPRRYLPTVVPAKRDPSATCVLSADQLPDAVSHAA